MNVKGINRIMGNVSTLCVIVSAVPVIYFLYSLHASHVLFTTNTVFDYRRALPGSVYLTLRYMYQSLRKTHVRRNKNTHDELVLTLINCRYDVISLRKFCSVVGYGWDYPDSVFRDIPLCYPEFLCRKLIAMTVCSENFRLSPSSLLRVREKVILHQAADELKRGLFSLQVRLLEYRTVSAGVEVDLSLTASRDLEPVWSSTVTLLSARDTRSDAQTDTEITHDLSSLRSIQLDVHWSTGMRCGWMFGDICPLHVFCLPASLLGFTCPCASSLWMFSRCMAEIEKRKGVEIVRAPLTVSVLYTNSPSLSKQVTIRMSESTETTTAAFSLQDHRTGTLYISGQIKRYSDKEIENSGVPQTYTVR